ELGAAVLRPRFLVRRAHERLLLTHARRLEPARIQAEADQEVLHRVRPAQPERQVVLVRATLVRVTHDPDANVRVRPQHGHLTTERLLVRRADVELVEVEVHHLREDLTGATRFLLCAATRLLLGATALLLQTTALHLRAARVLPCAATGPRLRATARLLQTTALLRRAARGLDAVGPGLCGKLFRRRARLLRRLLPTARPDQQRADQGREDDSLLHLASPSV